MYRTKLLFKFGGIIRLLIRLFPYSNIPRHQPDTNFRLVYFCGNMGTDYLIASINSVRLSWKQFPKILIITDGFPPDALRVRLGKWGGRVEIVSWEHCARFFAEDRYKDLVNYASAQLWGKKLIGILYSMAKYRTLYSDTDVLWFKDPTQSLPLLETQPVMKMSQDIEPSYSADLLGHMSIDPNNFPSLNAGLIYGYGDVSVFPGWTKMSRFLAKRPDNRSEQTALAILSAHFGSYWPMTEVCLSVSDINTFTHSPRINYREILARHYVNTKGWLFWRDYLWLLTTCRCDCGTPFRVTGV